ncbi:MAG TPA: CAP domain-containing protein [Propylenella sp.]
MRIAGLIRAAIALAAGMILAACTTGGPQQVTPIPVDAGRAASLVSAYRGAHGLGRVGVDSRLMQAAAAHARAMGERDRISHRIGGSLARRVSAAGYEWSATAENLGAGFSSLDVAMAGWKDSAGHRTNLLNPNVTEIGIAAVAAPPGSKHRNYWALILSAPMPERRAEGPFALEPIR